MRLKMACKPLSDAVCGYFEHKYNKFVKISQIMRMSEKHHYQ
jgi:hypothetical protein